MKQKILQLLGAFFLGVMVPFAMLEVHKVLPEGTVPAETEPTLQETVSPVKPMLQVLNKEGVVVSMDPDVYVLGVVLAEMPADFEEAALKAQAVVARTYAMKRQEEGNRHPMGAVCTDSACCQAYTPEEIYLQNGGKPESVEKVRAVVEQTSGQVLTYEGGLIEATYFSCSGGRTEDAVAVWGTDVPYLQAVDSPGEENAEKFAASVFFTAEEFAARLGRTLTGTPEQWLGITTRTEGGGVAGMIISGVLYSGVELRELLGLNSTAFTMTPGEKGITVSTLGHGHRVGMSQYGAEAMAVSGSTYEQILRYYYPGTRIDKIAAMG